MGGGEEEGGKLDHIEEWEEGVGYPGARVAEVAVLHPVWRFRGWGGLLRRGDKLVTVAGWSWGLLW